MATPASSIMATFETMVLVPGGNLLLASKEKQDRRFLVWAGTLMTQSVVMEKLLSKSFKEGQQTPSAIDPPTVFLEDKFTAVEVYLHAAFPCVAGNINAPTPVETLVDLHRMCDVYFTMNVFADILKSMMLSLDLQLLSSSELGQVLSVAVSTNYHFMICCLARHIIIERHDSISAFFTEYDSAKKLSVIKRIDDRRAQLFGRIISAMAMVTGVSDSTCNCCVNLQSRLRFDMLLRSCNLGSAYSAVKDIIDKLDSGRKDDYILCSTHDNDRYAPAWLVASLFQARGYAQVALRDLLEPTQFEMIGNWLDLDDE